jgi:hypothetical protein
VDVLETDYGDPDVAGWRYESFATVHGLRGIGGVVGYSDHAALDAKAQMEMNLEDLGIEYDPTTIF